MKTVLNYLGQLRVYSLVDLCVLLLATGATSEEFVGVICLHIGFLAYLESRHAHEGRNVVPKWVCPLLSLVGMFLYRSWEVVPFLLASFFYTKKTSRKWGIFASFFRGLQYFFLLAGITHDGWLPVVACVVIILRNAVGDWRDIEKDEQHGMKTLPMVLGISKGLRYIHLLAILVSSAIWWGYTDLSFGVLLGVFFVEVATYDLTPR